MIIVSDAQNEAPKIFQSHLQEQVYRTLTELKIPFQRVDTSEAITMEDCIQINKKLNTEIVKTLFLCDRKKTQFYLYVTCADKLFNTKEFSASLGVSRLSFAPAELMEQILGTKVGAATIFSVLLDSAKDVQLTIDRDLIEEFWYGCSDGVNTSYMKVETSRILNGFQPYVGKKAKVI